MPSLDDIRAAGERKLRGLLSRLSARHRQHIQAVIVRYGSVEQVPDSFWRDLQREIEEEEAAALLLLLLAADDWTTGRIRRQGVAAGGVTAEQLAAYSREAGQRAQVFGRQWIDTTRERLAGKEVEIPPGEPLTKRDLGEVLDLGRIERAAMSQTTTTISKAQLDARERALETAGEAEQRVSIEMIWLNNFETTQQPDERVCPICRPLHGTDESVWGITQPDGPGDETHPLCRCGLDPRAVVEAA